MTEVRTVRDDPRRPDPGFADLYAALAPETELEPWLSAARESAGLPILYLGIGTGRLAAGLQQEGIEIVGVDAHPGMLAVASNRLPGAELIEALIEDLELNRQFEVVLAPSSILYTPARLAGAARHLASAPRPGHLWFELTNPHWLAAGAPVAGPGHPVRVRSLSAGSCSLEVDYEVPDGSTVTQLAEFDLVWPEAIEEFLAGAGLELIRLSGMAGADLDTSPVFHVHAVPAGPRP